MKFRFYILTSVIEKYEGGMSTQFTIKSMKSLTEEHDRRRRRGKNDPDPLEGQRRRTSGGVFFYLAKTMPIGLSKEQIQIRDEIFEEETELFHQKVKSEQERGGDVQAKLLGKPINRGLYL